VCFVCFVVNLFPLSAVAALLGLVEALFIPDATVLLVSPVHRQSRLAFKIAVKFFRRLGSPLEQRCTVDELELTNGSQMVCVPGSEGRIRGYANVSLLIIDEAARVPDDLFHAVLPMVVVCNGRVICLSTPFGKRGFFHDAWANGGDDWQRFEVPASRIPRLKPASLEYQRRSLGAAKFRQEFGCSFESLEGLVYPDFARCVSPAAPLGLSGRKVGGIDFGFRNPFAAIWGTLDRDGVLWLTGEHYERGQSLKYHSDHLPPKVLWYADPSGAQERHDLVHADHAVRRGTNAVRAGIAAVTARLQTGTLRVVAGACPNLLAEAQLYRYDNQGQARGEAPLDEHNHALDALRYLINTLDARRMTGARQQLPEAEAAPDLVPPKPKPKPWLRLDNEALWRSDGLWHLE